MKNCSLQNNRVKRILLIRLRNIGDVLLMVPTIRAFREYFPGARIAALVNAGTEPMLTGNPLLDEVLVFDPAWKTWPWKRRVAEEVKFLREVRRRKFDLAINLTEGDRGAFLCLASSAGMRIGVYHSGRGLWWKKMIFHCLVRIPDWRAHVVEQMLEIPRSLGLDPKDKRVEIFYSPEDKEFISRILGEEGIGP